MYQKLNIISY